MPDVVCMLLSNDAVSDPRVEKEAVALSAAGYRVTVVAWNRSGTAAAREERAGFDIVRVGPPSVHGGGLANLGGYRAFWSEALRTAVELGARVVHCHDADTVPAGLSALRRLRRGGASPALVVDFHELYRDSKMVPQRGVVGLVARWFVSRIERSGVRAADLVIVANPGTAGYYQDLGASRLIVAENAPDTALFGIGAHEPHDGFTVCYIGQKRYFESLRMFMDAVGGVKGVRAVLAGGGVDEAAVAEYAKRYPNVTVEGRLRYAEIPARYGGCDAVYAVNDPRVGNMRVNFPVKAMEGMAFGLPVIVSAGTWIGDYVSENGIGLAVEADTESIRTAILGLRDDPSMARDMGRRGREIVESGLNWGAVADRVVSAYGEMAPTDV